MAIMLREQVPLAVPGTDRLLTARLGVPRLPRGYVDRRRLSDCLDASAGLPLTLVSSPAGTGKTVAAAAWAVRRLARGYDETLGWVTFEAGDDEPSIIWALVTTCLERHGVLEAGELAASPRPTRQELGAIGEALAAHPRPVTLVLDRYDVADAELASGLRFLLTHSGGRLRLVLLTRADPALPLPSLRLADELGELRMAALALTASETRALLDESGVHLQDAAVASLARRTRGWVGAVRLAVDDLARRPNPDMAACRLTGDGGRLADYLVTEVLDTQPGDVREVLSSTSVVDVLPHDLAEALGGHSAPRILSALARSSSLVEELADPGGHRLHPLLRDLLRAELVREHPARLEELERRAAAWHAEHGAEGTPGAKVPSTAEGRTRRSPHLAGVVALPEPLTAKEHEVLAHLAELLTTEEIASAMFVSINTVRTHVRNILRKLAVNRRNEAVRRARALRLLET